MPTYEYECPECTAVYELQQSFSAETTHTCEKCGKGIAKRVLHAPTVVFKGSGWYVTDSRKASSATSDSATSGDNGGSDTSASAGSDTATAAG